MINRSAVTVKAKQPFRDWLRSLPDPPDATLEEVDSDGTVYLLSDAAYDEDPEETVRLFFGIIFEEELNGWWTDRKDWPQKRDFETFKQWFDAEFHSVVRDLVDAPLEDDGLD